MSLDAWGSAAAVRAGETTSLDLVRTALDRIKKYDGQVNAFTVVLEDEAIAAATALDEAAPSGLPLAGVPVSVKDHIWLAGALATNGSVAWRDFVPDVDAVAVARLKAAGAIVVGKTNNPEFCFRGYTDNDVWGLTRNPWHLDRTPGGSSGGAGASVAYGATPLALGTDGGGSIRIPAAFCGLVGHKPTFGLWPKMPGFRGWPTLSVDGPMARTVGEAALMLAVMAGPSPADDLTWPVAVGDVVAAAARAAVPSGRVAVSVDLGFAPVERDVRAVFARAVDALASAGWPVEEADPPGGDPTPMWNAIACAEGYASEGPLLAEWEGAMTPGTAEIVRAGERVTAAEYLDLQHERAAYTRAWAEFFGRYDLLLTPAMQMTALPVGILAPETIDGHPVDPFFDDWVTFCLPANLTGQPAASVPVGFGDHGLPVGLQIMGRRWADAAVLEAAAAVERLFPPQRPAAGAATSR